MHWSKSEKENVRLTEAGISKEVSLRSEKRGKVYFSTETDLNNLSIVQRKNLQQEKIFNVCPILSRVVYFSCALKKGQEVLRKLLATTQHIFIRMLISIFKCPSLLKLNKNKNLHA